MRLDLRYTERFNRGEISDRRLLLNLSGRNSNMTSEMLLGLNVAPGCVRKGVVRGGNVVPVVPVSLMLDPEDRRVLRVSNVFTSGFGSRCVRARRVLLNVLRRKRGLTIGVLGRTNVSSGSVIRLVVSAIKLSDIAAGGRDGPGCPAEARASLGVLSGCKGGLALITDRGGVSPMVKERGRVRETVRVLDEEAGGGPMFVKSPNIKGASITRKLTTGVTDKGIPSGLVKGILCALSVKSVLTKTGCENRFRREVGRIMSRMIGGKGVVLFVSRLRAVVNTKSAKRDAVSTSGVLGPMLSEKSVRVVKTAAVSRCEGRVRGSSTLREEFRPILVARPAGRRAVGVLRKLERGCRSRRGMGVACRTVMTTMSLSVECVASEFLPSGTVSLVSRSTSEMELERVGSRGGVLGSRGCVLDGRVGSRLGESVKGGLSLSVDAGSDRNVMGVRVPGGSCVNVMSGRVVTRIIRL